MSQPQPPHDVRSASAPPMKCIIRDRKGRRMVMPRYSPAEAIEQITRAVAGRNASVEQKQAAWDRLRDQQGFRLEWVLR